MTHITELKNLRNKSEITHRFGVLQISLNVVLCMLGLFSILFLGKNNLLIIIATIFVLINALCWVYFSNKTKRDKENVDEFMNNYMLLKNENIQNKE